MKCNGLVRSFCRRVYSFCSCPFCAGTDEKSRSDEFLGLINIHKQCDVQFHTYTIQEFSFSNRVEKAPKFSLKPMRSFVARNPPAHTNIKQTWSAAFNALNEHKTISVKCAVSFNPILLNYVWLLL